MLVRVLFPRLVGVMCGVERVAMRDVRMMRGLFVLVVLMVLRRLAMMLGRFFMVVGRLPVMFRSLVL